MKIADINYEDQRLIYTLYIKKNMTEQQLADVFQKIYPGLTNKDVSKIINDLTSKGEALIDLNSEVSPLLIHLKTDVQGSRYK